MGKLLDEGEVGHLPIRNLSERRKKIVESWAGLGFLEGLEGHERPNIAQLFESQASQLLNEVKSNEKQQQEEDIEYAQKNLVRGLRPIPKSNEKPQHLRSEIEKLTPEEEKEFNDKLTEDFAYWTDMYPTIEMGSPDGTQMVKLRTVVGDDGKFVMAEVFFELMNELWGLKKRGLNNPRLVVDKLELSRVLYDPNGFAPRRGLMIRYKRECDGKKSDNNYLDRY